MKKEAEANSEEDNRKKDEVQKINEADSMVFQTEKQIKEYGDKISDEDKKTLQDSVDKLKTLIENKDIPALDSQLEDMNSKWQEISQRMYESTQQEETTQEGNTDDTTDVEFEEVKED